MEHNGTQLTKPELCYCQKLQDITLQFTLIADLHYDKYLK